MQLQTESKPYDTINVTPMLDLAYVLLVVFILMTTASVQGITLALPKPSATPPAERHEVLVLKVGAGGALTLNGAPRTVAALKAELQAVKARDAKASVVVQGEGRASYEHVVAVIDLCNDVAIPMSLATARIGF